MTPTTIRKEIRIHAPAAQVWHYVGSPKGVRQWWGQEIWFEAKTGGRCVEQGRLHGKPCQWEGIVTRYDPPRQLVLTLHPRAAMDAAAGEVATISITLEAAQADTIVKVEHQVMQVLPQPSAIGQTRQLRRWPMPDRPAILNQLPTGGAQGNVTEREYTPALVDLASSLPDIAGWKALDAQWTNRLDALSHKMGISEK